MRRILVLVMAVILAAPAALAAQRRREGWLSKNNRYDIERYLNMRGSYAPAVGPRGAVAFLTNITPVPQLWRVDAPGAWPFQLTFGDDAVAGASWSPQGDWLIYAMSAGGSERTQLYLLAADGSAWEALTSNPKVIYEFGGWFPDGQKIFYASNERDESQFDLYTMDLITRQSQRILQSDGLLSPGTVSPNGQWAAYVRSRSNTDADLFVIELATGKAVHLNPHQGEEVVVSPCWSGDSRTVYFGSNRGRDFSGLVKIDIASKQWNWIDTPSWDVEEINVSRDGRLLAYTINEDGYSHLVLRSQSNLTPARLGAIPKGVMSGLQFSPESDRLYFALNGSTHPIDIFYYDVRTRTSTRVTRSSTAGIPESSFVEPQLVSYTASDGLRIPAFLYLPQGLKPGEKAPVIFNIHGGPESQTRPTFSSLTQYYLNRGYAVFAPNIRGSSGYGARYLSLDNVEKRLDSVRDVAEALKYLESLGTIDTRRAAITGGSYGGYMVLAILTEYPDLFAAGIDTVGIANFHSFLKNTGAWRVKVRAAEYGDPEKDKDLLTRISPINHVDRIKAPLMVIQGANDPRVPKSEADQIVESLRKRNMPVEYLLFDDEGHGLVKLPNRIKAYRAVADFLDRHLRK